MKIASASAGGGSGGTTGNIDITGATLLVAAVSVDASSGTVPTPTDSLGVDTWLPLTQVGGTNPPFFRSRLFYIIAPTTSATYAVTISGTNASITVVAYDDVLASGAFDLEASGGGAATSNTETASGGSVTPSTADSLVISGGGIEAVRTLSVGSGFTKDHEQQHVGGTSYGTHIGSKVLTASSAQNPAWTWTGQGNTHAVILNAVFKLAPPPTIAQSAYQWRNDDGSETTATDAAAQSANITIAAGTTQRLRVLVQATGNPASKVFKLQYRKVGGSTWSDV